jgi:AcrR family transcriptional regulator
MDNVGTSTLAAPVASASPTAATPDRLLAAAGEVFAERGFAAATVREICQRAAANIAAVNYHYGDKRGIYEAAFRFAHSCVATEVPPKLDARAARDRLRDYIRVLLGRLLDDERPAWHAKLLAREMIEPTGVLDEVVERSIRPRFDALQALLKPLLGDDAAPETLRRCAASIIGQCAFYRHSRPILTRLDPTLRFGADDLARLAEHITEFSLAGLRALRATPARAVRPARRRRARR